MKKIRIGLLAALLSINLTACASPDLEASEQHTGSTEILENKLANVNVRGTIVNINGNEVTIDVEIASPVGERDTIELESDSLKFDVTGVSIVRVTRGVDGVTEEAVSIHELSEGDTLFVTFSANGTIENISFM